MHETNQPRRAITGAANEWTPLVYWDGHSIHHAHQWVKTTAYFNGFDLSATPRRAL